MAGHQPARTVGLDHGSWREEARKDGTACLALCLCGCSRSTRSESDREALFEEPVPDLARLEGPLLAKEENAATWLLGGVDALLSLTPDERGWLIEVAPLALSEWSPELEEKVRTLVERERDALETLHKAADCEKSDFATPYLNDPLIQPMVGFAVQKMLHNLIREVLRSTEPWATSPAVLKELEAMLPTTDGIIMMDGGRTGYFFLIRYGPGDGRGPSWQFRYPELLTYPSL